MNGIHTLDLDSITSVFSTTCCRSAGGRKEGRNSGDFLNPVLLICLYRETQQASSVLTNLFSDRNKKLDSDTLVLEASSRHYLSCAVVLVLSQLSMASLPLEQCSEDEPETFS